MVSILELLFLIALGRLFIYLWSEFPTPEWFDQSRFGKLKYCTLCSGVWIYSAIFIIYGADILGMIGLPENRYIGGLLSGGLVSFVMYLLEIGFIERFMVITIE